MGKCEFISLILFMSICIMPVPIVYKQISDKYYLINKNYKECLLFNQSLILSNCYHFHTFQINETGQFMSTPFNEKCIQDDVFDFNTTYWCWFEMNKVLTKEENNKRKKSVGDIHATLFLISSIILVSMGLFSRCLNCNCVSEVSCCFSTKRRIRKCVKSCIGDCWKDTDNYDPNNVELTNSISEANFKKQHDKFEKLRNQV